VIERLVEMAKELREVESRGEKLGLSDEEIAFYDAVAKGREYIESDERLLDIVKRLVDTIWGWRSCWESGSNSRFGKS
jgi:type I restriction enzyme R subunit